MGHTMKLLIARKASSQSKEEAVSVHIYVYRLGVGPMWYALNRRVQLLRNAFLCNCNASALFRNRTALCVMLILLEGFAAPVKTAQATFLHFKRFGKCTRGEQLVKSLGY